MSNTIQNDWQPAVWLVAGALLATLGGMITEWVKIKLDKRQKTSATKARLLVLIDKSVKSIRKLVQTYEQTTPHLIHSTYIDKLKAGSAQYDHTAENLYLLDPSLRDRIMDFFDNQNTLIVEVNELISATGMSSKEEKKLLAEHDRKINTFRSLQGTGEKLVDALH